jgi:iron complex outermembrane recepter protein
VSLAWTDSDGTTSGVAPANRWAACCLLGMVLGFWACTAESDPSLSTAIAPQPLAAALAEFAYQTGLQLVYVSKIAAGRTSKGARAGLSTAAALTELLNGTGLTFQFLNERTVRIFQPVAIAPTAQPTGGEALTKRSKSHEMSSSDTLDELIVLGLREQLNTVEYVQSVPASVSVVRGDRLEMQGRDQLSDYGAYLPGFNAPGGFVVVRGVAAFTNATSVAFYLDDTPMGASGPYAGACCLDLTPYDLERFEVLRGPQGTLFGGGSEVGMIRYVLKEPNVSDFEGRVGADGSTVYGASKLGDSFRAFVNVPMVKEVLGVRLSAYDSYIPGYIDNAYSGAKDVNVIRRYGERLAMLWRPSASLSVKVNALWYRNRSDSTSDVSFAGGASVPNTGDASIFVPVRPFGDLKLDRAFLDPAEGNTEYYSAKVNWDPGSIEVVSATAWSRTQGHSSFDFTLFDGASFPMLSAGAIPAGLARGDVNDSLEKFTEELRLVSAQHKRIDWLLGAFYGHDSVRGQDVEHAFDKAYQPIAAFAPYLDYGAQRSTFKEWAVFGDLTWRAANRFDLIGGIRYAHNDQAFNNIDRGLLFPSSDTSGVASEGATTWMATARFRFTPEVMLYGRVATGYQPGYPNGAMPGVPLTVKAETLTNYEAGLKSEFLDRKALVDLSVFYIDWNNIQLSVSNTGGVGYTTNGGKAQSQGLELASSYAPLPGMKLGFNAAFTQIELTAVVPAAQYLLLGYQLPNVPKWSLSFTADEDWSLTRFWHANVGAGLRWVGQEWGSAGGVGVQSRSLGGTPTIALPSYSVLDLHAGIAKGPLTLRAFARNLTDKRAWLQGGFLFPDTSITPGHSDVFILQPRTVGVGFDYAY